ncbi:MAG: ATP-binding protein [Methanospirillum sp.]|uniref:ATP-binding protein n=1 Tax=Methanospirillum sp. TaxID=45200 RepID=UPI0023709C9D|nr:ATP-binding protein [Methanospirillum sp.]MDD1729009.1 ATP-binding protein [Methanospirillum sp.]
MQIAIASGKGGTGKTTVTVNLALALSSSIQVTLADCDVEEPNLHLFFSGQAEEEEVTVLVPEIDTGTCILCGKCGQFCRYGALIVLKDQVLQYPKLCHSCGGCSMVCPTGSISERSEVVGVLHRSNPEPSLRLITGTLCEGSIHTTTVIRAVRNQFNPEDLVLLDAPPGTACAAMETLEGCDFCLLVTEPTPFGLHDLTLIYKLAQLYHIPVGVVINRSDTTDSIVEFFCRDQNIPILMHIPFDRTIALQQGSGQIISRADPKWREQFFKLGQDCITLAGVR